MSQDLPSIGKIIHDYRMANDITAKQFAAACGRSREWVYAIEKTGQGYERTWTKIGREYPDLKQAIIRVIGRYPPQEYTRINAAIQAGRANMRV